MAVQDEAVGDAHNAIWRHIGVVWTCKDCGLIQRVWCVPTAEEKLRCRGQVVHKGEHGQGGICGSIGVHGETGGTESRYTVEAHGLFYTEALREHKSNC